jgi:hypothetical protein
MEVLFVPESLLVEQFDGEEMLTRETSFGRTQSLAVMPDAGHAKYEGCRRRWGSTSRSGRRVETTCGLTCGRIGAGW